MEATPPLSATRSVAATAEASSRISSKRAFNGLRSCLAHSLSPKCSSGRMRRLNGWRKEVLYSESVDYPALGGRTNRLRLLEIGWWLGHRDLLTFRLWGRL